MKKITRTASGKFWQVEIGPNDYKNSAGKPIPGGIIGLINDRGTINVWMPAGSAPRETKAYRKLILEDARHELIRSGELVTGAHKKSMSAMRKSGDFLVILVNGKTGKRSKPHRFHTFNGEMTGHGFMPGSNDFAQRELKSLPTNSKAEFWRDHKPEPISLGVLGINEYGHIKYIDLSRHDPRRSPSPPSEFERTMSQANKIARARKRAAGGPRKPRITPETKIIRTGPREWMVGNRKFKTFRGAEGYWGRETAAERSRRSQEGRWPLNR